MSRLLFLSLIYFGSHISGWSQTDHSVTLTVEKIKEIKGSLKVCITNDPDAFLEDCIAAESVAVSGAEMQVTFTNLPSGTYAVSLFQDLDDDGELACEGLFGLPSEPYGFSNNPGLMFGPPSFRKSSFLLTEDKNMVIRLK